MSSGDVSEQCRRFCVLSWEQVQRLDSILGETVPVHGRGNFPTLSVQPRQIVQVIMKAHLSEYFFCTLPQPYLFKPIHFTDLYNIWLL